MAKSTIPNPLERRHLVERDLDTKIASNIARAYLEAGRKLEAVDFLAKADDQKGLRAIAAEAIAEGDPFLLQTVTNFIGEDPDRATWERCADAAEAKGKERYAATARRNAARCEA